MRISDWSSDVCSSDLHHRFAARHLQRRVNGERQRARFARDVRDKGDRRAELADRARETENERREHAGERKRQADRAKGVPAPRAQGPRRALQSPVDPRSEEHTSELQSLMRISYAVFCLKKKTKKDKQ